MKILYRLEALADLNGHVSHIARDDSFAAKRVGVRIRSAINRLAIFPYSGRTGCVADTRELIVAQLPYIVVYRVTNCVEIIAIVHGRERRNHTRM